MLKKASNIRVWRGRSANCVNVQGWMGVARDSSETSEMSHPLRDDDEFSGRWMFWFALEIVVKRRYLGDSGHEHEPLSQITIDAMDGRKKLSPDTLKSYGKIFLQLASVESHLFLLFIKNDFLHHSKSSFSVLFVCSDVVQPILIGLSWNDDGWYFSVNGISLWFHRVSARWMCLEVTSDKCDSLWKNLRSEKKRRISEKRRKKVMGTANFRDELYLWINSRIRRHGYPFYLICIVEGLEQLISLFNILCIHKW